MEIKLFEVRDRATFIPMLAVALGIRPSCSVQGETPNYLLERAGFGPTLEYVILVGLTDMRAQYDSYAWNDRTRSTAHRYILEHWRELASGAVIDVEYILGETTAPKVSESLFG